MRPVQYSVRFTHSCLWRKALTLGLAACLMFASGCASVPDAHAVIDHAEAAEAKPHLVNSKGPLTVRQSQALFDRLGLNAPDSDLLQKHLAIEQEIAEGPLVAGNATRLLRDGEETFGAIFDAIRDAKRHIHMEYYIFEDVEHQGRKLVDLLLDKRREGVEVSLIYDSFGSLHPQSDIFARLRDAGVNLVEFNPINPLVRGWRKSPNDRDHRKIFIVDGQRAIVGGINLSVTYQSVRVSGGSDASPPDHWRDTDMEIRGPAVAELQKLFLDQWRKHGGVDLPDAGFFPQMGPQGAEVVRVIGSTPDHRIARYYVTLLSAIRNAEKSIWVTNSYFVPTEDLKQDLMAAARRGVDVRLLVPNKTDVKPALAIQRSHYEELLKAGIRIFENPHVVLHAKSVVIDGLWSVVGSSNLDYRSVLFNDEVDVVVLGRATGDAVQRMFENDMRQSKEILPDAWRKRPLLERMNELFSRFLQPWL